MSPTITDSTLTGEMPWRKSVEALREVPQGYLNIPGYAQAQAPWPMFPDGSGRRRKTVTTPGEMRKDLDDLAIDIGILFPDFFLFHAALQQSDYAVALAKAYNRWLVEEWLGEPEFPFVAYSSCPSALPTHSTSQPASHPSPYP